MRQIGVVAMLILAMVLGATAQTAAEKKGGVELKVVAEKEIQVVGTDGVKIMQKVPADKVIPGEEVIYTITFTNSGDRPAENLVVKNPIPEHMNYVGGSAAGENSVITYSVDNGQSFDVPGKLTVKDTQGKTQAAEASDYTHVCWTLTEPVAPNSSGMVSFRARLE